MKDYELTIVLPGDVSGAKKKSVTEKVEKLVKILKGNVTKIDDWGKIELTYRMKKNKTGCFLHFILELEGSVAKTLRDKLKLEEEILRYLLVRKE